MNIETLKGEIDREYAEMLGSEINIQEDKKRLVTLTHPGYRVRAVNSLAAIVNSVTVAPNEAYSHISYHLPTLSTQELKRILINPNDPNEFITSNKEGSLSFYKLERNLPIMKKKWTVDASRPPKRKHNPLPPKRKQKNTSPSAFAWSPDGNSIVTTYPTSTKKETQEHQVSIMSLDQGTIVDTRLYYDAHKQGNIKGITFIQGSSNQFFTGGKDHRAVYWQKKEEWKPLIMHDKIHSQEIMGMCDCKDKCVLYSVGRDSKLVAYDYKIGKKKWSTEVDAPVMNVYMNPKDPELLMLYTNESGSQLQLYDTRFKDCLVSTRGWIDATSKKSTLVNQDWSPNGVLIACGSVDPVIHVYDIRYDSGVGVGVYSIEGVKGSVYDVKFHPSRPLLFSVTGDHLVGLHELL